MLSEANIIESLKSQFPQYIGDDAEILESISHQKMVLTKSGYFRGW